ncbi:hypothetical protein QR90_04060 [Deinococcus radiopugnans]|uniref:Uncharacterized protein n=2 Tax=Deinococcus radiopugnans TaxID=57497 RepID=A0A0A7KIU4_9DEIO|nr:hypothetical protein [Deinococcus radiopugnans]AIZ44448.1 hypothetical protein QR90_04060 [Deinococcus radiopugnans]MBB6018025.1 ABC-type multidrug transport system permease subunit [Deinococcus radiopugnans ATCC 19172]QLG10057.1 hypothetical protein HLB42_04195 [Deinococcus sp. D7000]TNM68672.1 hypothetical protein FHR04_16145 [Deinococcus radiopugnans ATCC 19172]
MAAPSPFNAQQAEAGRTPTLAVLLGIFMVTITPFVAGLVQGQTADWLRNLLYAFATAVLLYNVWRGSVWAWRLTVGFCMVAGLVVFVIGMLAGSVAWQGWVVSGAGLAYLLLGTALVGTAVIRAFLDARWAARGRQLRGRA